MELNLPIILLFALASVGLVEICIAVVRWLCCNTDMKQSSLVLVVRGHDDTVEKRLVQACTEVGLNRNLRGVKVVVAADSPDEETRELCRLCCADRGILYLEDSSLPALIKQ